MRIPTAQGIALRIFGRLPTASVAFCTGKQRFAVQSQAAANVHRLRVLGSAAFKTDGLARLNGIFRPSGSIEAVGGHDFDSVSYDLSGLVLHIDLNVTMRIDPFD